MWIIIISIGLVMDFGWLTLLTETSRSSNIKITRIPKDYFPKSGSLQLICEAEGSPTPTITWYDAQSMSPVEEEKSIELKTYKDDGLLIIQKPTEKEIYEFYCNASNGHSWIISNTVRTGRAFLTSIFRLEPVSIQIVKLMQTVFFSCRPPIGIPYPKVHWLKDGKLFLRKAFIRDANRIFFLSNDKKETGNEHWSLKITKSEVLDSGRYQCVATNDYGRVESFGSWLVVSNNAENRLGAKIENKLVNLHQDVTFLCDMDYTTSVKWISSKLMSLNSRINVSSKSLTIKEVTLLDKGIYACETLGNNPKLLKIYRLNVGVSDIMEDKIRSRKKVVIEGVNVVLECDLENSQTEVYWETPNSPPIFPQDESHNRIKASSNGNLNIKSVQLSDSGKYTCNAHSSLDVAHKSIWLEVSKHQLDNYPIISIPCQNISVVRGSTINLRCEVIGEDIIKIIWYKGLNIKQRLHADQRTSFPSKDSLRIVNADRKEDTNFYTCEALNDQGRKATWTSSVRVVESYEAPESGELPLPPVVESPRNVRSTSIDLTWSSTNVVGTLYWVEYVFFGSNTGWSIYKKEWKENHITIDNLTPDTWYQFLVRSKNRVGIGRASVPTEYVKTKRDDKLSGLIGFTFSKIRLHIPMILNGQETKLIWSLDRIANDDKSQTAAQFSFIYRPISILQCIIAMSNGYEFESSSVIPSFSNYCSLSLLSSEKLKLIKNNQPNLSNKSDVTMAIDFSKINLTTSSDQSNYNYGKMSWMMPNLTAFNCLNISIVSDKGSRLLRSNYRLLLTPETRPSERPEKVHITWVLPEVSINIGWQMPSRDHWNGLLTGSHIYMKSNESEIVLKYNDTLTQKIIKQVNSDLDWSFSVSITNCAGESDKSDPIILKRLTSSLGVPRLNDTIFKKSWMIAMLVITSLLIWVMLCLLTVYLCCIRSNGVRHHKNVTTDSDTMKNIVPNETFTERISNHLESDKILPEATEDKSSSNNCTSSGQSSSPSNVSFCNPYASTQLFDGIHDNKSTDLSLFYLSTPIFEPVPVNKGAPIPMNYYLSNVPDWVGNPILTGSFQGNPKMFPFHFQEEYRRNSNDSDSLKALKTQQDENGVINTNGAISNLLISTAPFSDQFSGSSKGKSTPNSSNSDSNNHHTHPDSSIRYGLPNVPTKPNRRRQDLVDIYDQSTEMTHLLIDNNDNKCSPSIARVYDIPYSESSVDSRRNSQSKE